MKLMLPRQPQPRHLDGFEPAAGDLRQCTSSRKQRDPQSHLDGMLDAIEAGQGDLDVDRGVTFLKQSKDAFPCG